MNILLIIDVQNDFCEEGALACKGGKDLAQKLNELMNDKNFDLVVATQDWHPADHVSFATTHDGHKPFEQVILKNHVSGEDYYQTLWPNHCVQNSLGAELYTGVFQKGPVGVTFNQATKQFVDRNAHIVPLDTSKIDIIVRKGVNKNIDSYSGLSDNFDKKTGLYHLLKSLLLTERDINITVTGIATDVCVLATVRGLLKLFNEICGSDHCGHKIFVPENFCVGVTKEGHENALEKIRRWGIDTN